MTNEVVKKQYKKDPKTGEWFGEDKKKKGFVKSEQESLLTP
jgi:hypothetical protein